MRRSVIAALLAGVLGCGTSSEPNPSTPTSRDTSTSQARKSEPAPTEELIADGKRQLEQKDYPAAIETFTRVIQIDDQSGLAYRERAWARMLAAGFRQLGSDAKWQS
jgi:Tfp pilus assembly protein PilF